MHAFVTALKLMSRSNVITTQGMLFGRQRSNALIQSNFYYQSVLLRNCSASAAASVLSHNSLFRSEALHLPDLRRLQHRPARPFSSEITAATATKPSAVKPSSAKSAGAKASRAGGNTTSKKSRSSSKRKPNTKAKQTSPSTKRRERHTHEKPNWIAALGSLAEQPSRRQRHRARSDEAFRLHQPEQDDNRPQASSDLDEAYTSSAAAAASSATHGKTPNQTMQQGKAVADSHSAQAEADNRIPRGAGRKPIDRQATRLHVPRSKISAGAMRVIGSLTRAGFPTLLVGGAVRDILLGNEPKDFDILTAATNKQVNNLFKRERGVRCLLVGKRFPIAHVTVKGELFEVSSFGTKLEKDAPRPPPAGSSWSDPDWRLAREGNALRRDFTVNGMLLDVSSGVLYDYVGGQEDCSKRILRSIGDPVASMAADPARALRAVRLAARVGLEIEGATASAIQGAAPAVSLLNQARLQMEMASMLTRGCAASTFKMLWRYRLLDILLPLHAAHMVKHKAARNPRSKSGHDQVPLLRALAALDAQPREKGGTSPSVSLAALAVPLLADSVATRGRPAATKPWMDKDTLANMTSIIFRQIIREHVAVSGDDGGQKSSAGSLFVKRLEKPAWLLLNEALLNSQPLATVSKHTPGPRESKKRGSSLPRSTQSEVSAVLAIVLSLRKFNLAGQNSTSGR